MGTDIQVLHGHASPEVVAYVHDLAFLSLFYHNHSTSFKFSMKGHSRRIA